MKKCKIVKVTWIDAQSLCTNLQSFEEAKSLEPIPAEIVGIFVLMNQKTNYLCRYWF